MKFVAQNSSTFIWILYLIPFFFSEKILAQFEVDLAHEILRGFEKEDKEDRDDKACEIPTKVSREHKSRESIRAKSECFEYRGYDYRPYRDDSSSFATSFYRDQEHICPCLEVRSKKFGENFFIKTDEEKLKVDLIRGNFRKKMQELSILQNGMMIQAQSLTSSLVDSGRMSRDEHLDITSDYRSELQLDGVKPGEIYKKSVGIQVDRQILYMAERTKLPPDKIEIYHFPSSDELNECFSMKTFWQIESVPNQVQDKEFLTFIKDLKEISPETWQYQKIQMDLNSAKYNFVSKEESLAKSKLSFIMKNPLYGNLFASNDPKVKAQQNQLLKLLKMKYLDNSCPSKTLDCFHLLQEKNQNLDEKISLIFKHPDVILATKIVQAQRAQEILDHPEDLFAPKIPITKIALEERFTFISGYNLDNCIEGLSATQLEKCKKYFASYCPLLNFAQKFEVEGRQNRFSHELVKGPTPIREKGFFNTHAENYIETILSNLNPSSAKNPKYRDLVDLVCHQPHVKTVGDKKEVMTFPEYKENFLKDHCQKSEDANNVFKFACDNPNLIIVEFLKEYNELTDSNLNTDYKTYKEELIQNFGAFAFSSKFRLEGAEVFVR